MDARTHEDAREHTRSCTHLCICVHTSAHTNIDADTHAHTCARTLSIALTHRNTRTTRRQKCQHREKSTCARNCVVVKFSRANTTDQRCHQKVPTCSSFSASVPISFSLSPCVQLCVDVTESVSTVKHKGTRTTSMQWHSAMTATAQMLFTVDQTTVLSR